MSINKSLPALQIIPQELPFHLHQYPASCPLPKWTINPNTQFYSTIKTPEEVSIVYSALSPFPPSDTSDGLSGQEVEGGKYEGPWFCFRVKGPMELNMTGILHSLSDSLRRAGIPIFALSTWYVYPLSLLLWDPLNRPRLVHDVG